MKNLLFTIIFLILIIGQVNAAKLQVYALPGNSVDFANLPSIIIERSKRFHVNRKFKNLIQEEVNKNTYTEETMRQISRNFSKSYYLKDVRFCFDSLRLGGISDIAKILAKLVNRSVGWGEDSSWFDKKEHIPYPLIIGSRVRGDKIPGTTVVTIYKDGHYIEFVDCTVTLEKDRYGYEW